MPFSFFIIVPFAELLLPVALKMFQADSGTFETEKQGKKAFRSAMQTLLARQRLTGAASTLLASHKDHSELLRRVASGDSLNPKQIRTIAPLCGRDGPLSINRLPPSVLTALCAPQACTNHVCHHAAALENASTSSHQKLLLPNEVR